LEFKLLLKAICHPIVISPVTDFHSKLGSLTKRYLNLQKDYK